MKNKDYNQKKEHRSFVGSLKLPHLCKSRCNRHMILAYPGTTNEDKQVFASTLNHCTDYKSKIIRSRRQRGHMPFGFNRITRETFSKKLCFVRKLSMLFIISFDLETLSSPLTNYVLIKMSPTIRGLWKYFSKIKIELAAQFLYANT